MSLDINEVARSVELYNLEVELKRKSARGDRVLAFTKEPPLRDRSNVGKVVVAFGSYDPLTIGHVSMFQKGLRIVNDLDCRKGFGSLCELAIVTSTTHIEKNVDLNKNSTLSDRIHAQEGFASSQGNVSLAFANAPYFVSLVPLFEKGYGENVDIYFLVGADVMEKVVDKPLYDKVGFDIGEVLKTLFRHRFIVVDRDVTYNKACKKPRLLNANKIIEENPILNQYSDRIISTDLNDDQYLQLRIPIEGVSSSL